MNATIPYEICNELLSDEEVLLYYTGKNLGYYFTGRRILIEKNEALENAGKSGSVVNFIIGCTVKPKRYSSYYYTQIEDVELRNFAVKIIANNRVEELRFLEHKDAIAAYRFAHDKIEEVKRLMGRDTFVGPFNGPIITGGTFQAPVSFRTTYEGSANIQSELETIRLLLEDDDARLQQKFEELKAELEKEPPKKDRKAFWEGVFSFAKNAMEIAASLVKIFAGLH